MPDPEPEFCRRANGMNIIDDLFARLRRQTNERVILGLKALALLLACAVYLEFSEQVEATRLKARTVRNQTVSITGLDAEALWTSRAETAREILGQWKDGVWRAPTAGVAAAKVQGEIETLARSLALDRVTVQVNPDPMTVESQVVLRFDVSARGDRGMLVRFLAAASLHMPRLVATDVNANFNDRGSTMRLSGIALYDSTRKAGDA